MSGAFPEAAAGEFASCCLLSFNRPEFVKKAVTSAIEMANWPLEMIVHDDGSDEATVQVLLDLHRQGYISTLILNPEGHNQGQGIALNRMFQMAKGDPIIKMDHDLIFRPYWLAQCVQVLKRNASLPIEPRIGALGLFKYEADPVDYRQMFIAAYEGWEHHKDFVGSAMVIPRDSYEKFGPFEERSTAFAEDYVFKKTIDDARGWANALLPSDVVVNQGFGYGPSTVVVKAEDGSLTSREIKEEPWLVGSRAWAESF